MPWVNRPGRRRSIGHLRQGLRRWYFDHSQGLTSFWIGVGVVAVAAVVIVALKIVT